MINDHVPAPLSGSLVVCHNTPAAPGLFSVYSHFPPHGWVRVKKGDVGIYIGEYIPGGNDDMSDVVGKPIDLIYTNGNVLRVPRGIMRPVEDK